MIKNILTTLLVFSAFTIHAEEEEPVTLSAFIESFQMFDGYVPYYWDADNGKLYLKIDTLDQDFLYISSLSQGLGSNDIGLDRGQLGRTHVVHFEKVGNKILLVEPNLDYRAITDNPDERAAVEQAFAKSVLWGFKIEKKDDGQYLVDATDFFIRDAHNVVGSLKRSKQGSFSLDESRSAMNFARTKNFERNSEFDVMLTFTGTPEGAWVRSVTPDPTAITIHQHHSFVELPDEKYTPRKFDPRSGSFAISFYDYATPIDAPLEQNWIQRHRLKKLDPSAEKSEAVEPIIYYLDRGTPEPIRSALLEGARWWNQAFEGAGFIDAFQVKVLPEGADPMDLNYNVIQWVHRRTRGWSYGSSVTDPRTGEIIKGHVSLGSLRVRQDFLIAQALTAPFTDENADTLALTRLALARLRQLSAHEVGHTLGFAHNFAASVNNRASVMDYPHPNITLTTEGNIDLSDAYATGIGNWDRLAVYYAYADFPEGANEESILKASITQGIENGQKFISDQDARPLGGAHPYAHLWDGGSDAAEELARVLAVRAKALENFSENNIPIGTPMSELEEALVPLYLFHRYQVEAAAKLIGGMEYTYAVRGDGQLTTKLVDGESQLRALETLLTTLHANTLTLSESILKLIPPRSYGDSRHRELFDIRTGLTIDPLAMAESAADHTLTLLFHPARASRMIEHHGRDESLPTLTHIIQQVLQQSWYTPPPAGLPGEVHRVVNETVLTHLFRLASDDASTPQVRNRTHGELAYLSSQLNRQAFNRSVPKENRDMYSSAKKRIDRFLENPEKYTDIPRPDLPPGSPIGMEWCSVGN
jgi:hypothetical protein